MAAIVSIVGRAKTGKTTLVEKLVTILTRRGYRVATAKHVFHELAFDKPGKDSFRHIDAGSKAVVFGSADKVIMVQPIKGTLSIDGMLRLLGEDYDLIIVEGFKTSDLPKIEVHRKEMGAPLATLPNMVAIATNDKLPSSIRQFELSDGEAIADFIEDVFIKAKQDYVSIYLNKKRIPVDRETAKSLFKTIETVIPDFSDGDEDQTAEILLRKPGRK